MKAKCFTCGAKPLTFSDDPVYVVLGGGGEVPTDASRRVKGRIYCSEACAPAGGYRVWFQDYQDKELDREFLDHIIRSTKWFRGQVHRHYCECWSNLHWTPPRVRDKPRDITPRMRAQVMERDGFRCRRCGSGPEFGRLVIDHVTPVALGGSNAIGNLQTLCELCNIGKAANEPHPHDLRVEIING